MYNLKKLIFIKMLNSYKKQQEKSINKKLNTINIANNNNNKMYVIQVKNQIILKLIILMVLLVINNQ